jgi:nickel-dependent lactate racemase
MTEIQLAYGTTSVGLNGGDSRFEVLSPHKPDRKPLTDFQLGEQLDRPIASAPLDELFSATDSILLVVSDATRATGSAQIVNLLVRRLIEVGVSPGNLAIIFATGIHRAVTALEKNELLTPFVAQRIKTLDHDAYDASQMISLGTTKRGTPVELNRALKDYSHVVITGGIGFHYFAGFTGGRKSICPGLASARTIEATHMLALDFETGQRRNGVNIAGLKGNAVHEECDEIAAMIGPTLGINAVVDEQGRTVRLYSGDWREAHATACAEYLEDHSIGIEAKREVVIVSCGGSPYDINLIQAHKALDMAAHACIDGGEIILLAECADGLGRPDFLKWFDVNDSAELSMRLRSNYEVNGQTAWSLLTKAERYRVQLLSALPDKDVRQMRMLPAGSLDEAAANLKRTGAGYILPRGAALLPQLL